MAVYYVSKSGSDSNNGLGPDASHASNKPWLTIGKALGAAGISSGDTVYVGPGVYRETVTVAMTSATAETKVYGDPCNKQGFKNGSGVLLSAQPVRWTAWTTDDKTTPAATSVLNLNGRDYLTFQDIYMHGAPSVATIQAATGDSTNITFRRIHAIVHGGNSSSRTLNFLNSTSAASVWLFDSCILINFNASGQFLLNLVSVSGADYDSQIIFRNCIVMCVGSTAFDIRKSGASSNAGGGIIVDNCIVGALTAMSTGAGVSTTIPSQVRNSVLLSNTGLNANASGQITENYNAFCCATPRTNVSSGANSATSYGPLVELGQSILWGFLVRPTFSPTFDSPLLGFGTDGSVSLTTDILGRDRPSGCGITWANTSKAVGCYEFHDCATKESSVTDAGDGWKFTGPGDHDVIVPVDATSTTISIKVRYDTNHGTGSKPQVELIEAADIGVASGQTLTASVGVDTWETLTFSAITPTSAGWVIIRLRSRSAAGNGLCYFDTVAVT